MRGVEAKQDLCKEGQSHLQAIGSIKMGPIW